MGLIGLSLTDSMLDEEYDIQMEKLNLKTRTIEDYKATRK